MDSSVVHLLHFIIYFGFYSDTFKADSTDGGALTIKDFFKAAEEGNRKYFLKCVCAVLKNQIL